MTDLTELLAPIRATLATATPGPWETRNEGPGEPWRVCHDREYVIYLGFDTVAEFTENDADFIAAARTDVPRLVAAVEAVLELAEKWRYQGEFSWGPWQLGKGPDPEGQVLDEVANEIRTTLTAALGDGQ